MYSPLNSKPSIPLPLHPIRRVTGPGTVPIRRPSPADPKAPAVPPGKKETVERR